MIEADISAAKCISPSSTPYPMHNYVLENDEAFKTFVFHLSFMWWLLGALLFWWLFDRK
jgi:hypothetical protein